MSQKTGSVLRVDKANKCHKNAEQLKFFKIDANAQIPQEENNARIQFEKLASNLQYFYPTDVHKYDQYFKELLSMAQGVFSPEGFTPEGLDSINDFKERIVRDVSPKISKQYLGKFFKYVLMFFFFFLIGAYSINYFTSRDEIEVSKINNPVAAPNTGQIKISVINTGWLLAFSMLGLFFAECSRKLPGTFESLIFSEADLVHPWIKLLFYSIPIFFFALIFQLKIITISFMGGAFSTDLIAQSIWYAILFGLLFGFSERAIPKKLTNLSEKFISQLSNDSI